MAHNNIALTRLRLYLSVKVLFYTFNVVGNLFTYTVFCRLTIIMYYDLNLLCSIQVKFKKIILILEYFCKYFLRNQTVELAR